VYPGGPYSPQSPGGPDPAYQSPGGHEPYGFPGGAPAGPARKKTGLILGLAGGAVAVVLVVILVVVLGGGGTDLKEFCRLANGDDAYEALGGYGDSDAVLDAIKDMQDVAPADAKEAFGELRDYSKKYANMDEEDMLKAWDDLEEMEKDENAVVRAIDTIEDSIDKHCDGDEPRD
jgi:hypothetical protein